MFGLASKTDLAGAMVRRREQTEKTKTDLQRQIWNLGAKLRGICKHEVVKEITYGYLTTNEKGEMVSHDYECVVCGSSFASKPKNSKIRRTKDVLSDK